MPTDPNALLTLAYQQNGLRGLTQPWHVEATYQLFDADGKPAEQGTFDEWWAGPEKRKVSYTSPSFTQTSYKNGDMTSVTGDNGWPHMREAMVEQYLVHPLGDPDSRMLLQKPGVELKTKLALVDQTVGAEHLKCVNILVFGNQEVGRRCFKSDLPIPIVTGSAEGLTVLFTNYVRIGGQYVAKQFEVLNGNLPIVKVDVVALDVDLKMDDATVTAPASAVVSAEPPNVVAGPMTSGANLYYPINAKSEGIHGTVILEGVITKEGKVDDLTVVSGPKALQGGACASVKTWKYQPYTRDGVPIEVQAIINVVY